MMSTISSEPSTTSRLLVWLWVESSLPMTRSAPRNPREPSASMSRTISSAYLVRIRLKVRVRVRV